MSGREKNEQTCSSRAVWNVGCSITGHTLHPSYPLFVFQSSAQASPCLRCIPKEGFVCRGLDTGIRQLLAMLLVKLLKSK